MTNGEARMILGEIHFHLMDSNQQIWDKDDLSDAIVMAIEALQAKTDGDLISRQAAIDAIASDINYLQGEIDKCKSDPSKYTDNFKLLMTSRLDGLLDAQQNIESLPSAEPRKGKWVRRIVGTDYWHCSECGDYGLHTDFCPMCGADMRGEE